MTIEKLVRLFRLIEVPDKKFKSKTNEKVTQYFINNWKNKLENEDISRLKAYKMIYNDFTLPIGFTLPTKESYFKNQML